MTNAAETPKIVSMIPIALEYRRQKNGRPGEIKYARTQIAFDGERTFLSSLILNFFVQTPLKWRAGKFQFNQTAFSASPAPTFVFPIFSDLARVDPILGKIDPGKVTLLLQ